MNNTILENLRKCVAEEDDLYILGDLTLGPHEAGIDMLKHIPGHIHIILGNHDTDTRVELYKQLPNVVEIVHATRFNYKKYHFYLSHYPTITSNDDYEKPLKERLLNICGHSHAENKWQDIKLGYIYHCEVDAHNCMPITIDKIIEDFQAL